MRCLSFYRLSLVVMVALFMAGSTSFGAEPTLLADVDSRSIYVGDSFTLSITLDGAPSEGAQPEIGNTDKAQIRGGEPRSQSSRSTTIINGKRTDSVIERTSWLYAVMPEETGVYSMGSASIKVNGKTLTTRIPEVTVVGAEPQPYVGVDVSSSRDSVLLDERFEITVGITVLKLNGAVADSNPMPGEGEMPGLVEIPFLSGGVKGAVFEPRLEDILNPLMQRRADAVGFRINDFAVDSGMSMFAMLQDRRPAVFYWGRTETELNGKPAWKYSLVIPMKATDEGVCRFPAARFKGTVYLNQAGSLEVKPRAIFAVAKPLEVKVTPPPETGRPVSFIGSLGTRMSASVAVDAQSCRQGDPLQLTLDIVGDLTTSNMREPRLFENKAMAERFRHYGDVGSDKTATGMRYTYKIRPMLSGTIEIPSLELSFYNTVTRNYETVNTAPVPLRVDPAPELDLNSILGVSTNASSARLALQQQQLVPSGITVSSSGVSKPETLDRRKAAAVVLVPPVAYSLLVAVARVWRRRKAFGMAVRRSSATTRSVRGILRAKTPQQIMDAVKLLLRDKMGVTGSGFTPGDIRTILMGQGVDSATCDEISQLLQEVFDSGFSPDADPAALVKARRGRIAELFADIKISLILIAVAGLAATSWGAQDNAGTFVWRQANASAASARTPEDFRQAALVYRELMDGGAVNGAVLYNYGTMLMLAGLSSEAVDAFERAEALDGASPELENNLDLALRAVDKSANASGGGEGQRVDSATALPWYRVPLFWHYGVPVGVRLEALAVMWGVFWLGAFLKFARLRRMGKVLVAAGLVGLAVFGSSVFASKRVLEKPLPPVPSLHETAERTVGR